MVPVAPETRALKVALVVLLLSITTGYGADSSYGMCEKGKDDCMECFETLKRRLLQNNSNIVNLIKAFFPPGTNQPEFVVVNYYFNDERDTIKTQTWFWAQKSSYLFFPLHIFQFLSLFFSKPNGYFTQEVNLTLNGTDCLDVKVELMELLTQRLKLYVQRSSINPTTDITYNAKAARRIDDIIDKDLARYIISLFIVGTALVAMVLLTVLYMCLYEKRLQWYTKLEKLNNERHKVQPRSAIIGIALISYILGTYILCLDGAAVYYRENFFQHLKVLQNHTEVSPHYFNLPIIIITLDILCMCTVLAPICTPCRKQKLYCLLATSTLGPIFCLIIHFPFIAIAFLNDAYHATSIFIFYTIVVFIIFGITEVNLITCQRRLANIKENETVTINDRTSIVGEFCILDTYRKVNIMARGQLNLRSNKIQPTQLEVASLEANLPQRYNQEQLYLITNSLVDVKHNEMEFQLKLRDGQRLQVRQQVNSNQENDTVIRFNDNEKIQVTGGYKLVYPQHSCNGPILYSKTRICCCYSLVIAILLSLLIVILSMITAFIVVIPVNMSISDAPNRLFSFYQIAIILVAAFFAYKKFFKKKKSIKSAVKERTTPIQANRQGTDEWNDMSNEEKLAEFYAKVVELVANPPVINASAANSSRRGTF